MNLIEMQILKALLPFCNDEGFKIIDAVDILSEVNHLESEELLENINLLSASKHIEVKYADKDEYCLAITNSGRAAVEEWIVKEAKALEKQKAEELAASKSQKSSKTFLSKKKNEDKSKLEEEVEKNTKIIVQSDTPLKEDAAPAIVIREIMLNRATLRSIAKIAFFSAFLGAVLGSIIVAVIFILI